jgi:hypothetical protein
MAGRSLSVAVIGAGMAGRSHAAAYRAVNTVFGEGLPPIRLAVIADANTALAEDAARGYGYDKAVSGWEVVRGPVRPALGQSPPRLPPAGFPATKTPLTVISTQPPHARSARPSSETRLTTRRHAPPSRSS